MGTGDRVFGSLEGDWPIRQFYSRAGDDVCGQCHDLCGFVWDGLFTLRSDCMGWDRTWRHVAKWPDS